MRKLFIAFCCLLSVGLSAQKNNYYLLVGTYTKGNSEGIYSYQFNADSGTAKLVATAKTDNPSYLTVSNKEDFVYAVKEGGDNNISAATAYNFDKHSGKLLLINTQNTKGAGPCYISVDKQNKWVFTANYKGGSLSAFGVLKDGSLDTVQQFIQHAGSSIVKDRQQEPHVHTAIFSTDEQYLFTTDLGTDKIIAYPFNASSKKNPLDTLNSIVLQSTAGNGPRHIAFNTSNKNAYIINELSGTIDVYSFKGTAAKRIQIISTDSTDNKDKGCADIHISADNKFLYATNRGRYNTISTFAVNENNGTLKLLQLLPSGGIMPRNFTIDPSGNYVLVGHQKSNNIAVFKRDRHSGLLKNTGKDILVGSPVCLKMGSIN